MRVRVTVRDKQCDVQLGDGGQSLLWLANAALCRFDSSLGMELGPPLGVRLEDGTQLPMDCPVADVLADGAHVFVILAREEEGFDDSAAGSRADERDEREEQDEREAGQDEEADEEHNSGPDSDDE